MYLIYYFFISGYNFIDNFNLYLRLDNLKGLFNETGFLIIFWSHFLAINLFCGSWLVNDGRKLLIPILFIKVKPAFQFFFRILRSNLSTISVCALYPKNVKFIFNAVLCLFFETTMKSGCVLILTGNSLGVSPCSWYLAISFRISSSTPGFINFRMFFEHGTYISNFNAFKQRCCMSLLKVILHYNIK